MSSRKPPEKMSADPTPQISSGRGSAPWVHADKESVPTTLIAIGPGKVPAPVTLSDDLDEDAPTQRFSLSSTDIQLITPDDPQDALPTQMLRLSPQQARQQAQEIAPTQLMPIPIDAAPSAPHPRPAPPSAVSAAPEPPPPPVAPPSAPPRLTLWSRLLQALGFR